MLTAFSLAAPLSAISCTLLTAYPQEQPQRPAVERIRIATFNIWVGGEKADADKDLSRRWTLEAMRALKADIIGVQEQKGFAPEYAAGLGFSHTIQDDSTALLLAPRFELVETAANRWGARVRTPAGHEVWVFNIHFPAAPYQPYQLHGIDYHGGAFISTPAQAVTQARLARGGYALRCLREMMPALSSGHPVFLVGDFNEPSHLDWTPAAADARGLPCAVEWPTTVMFHDAGMNDAYRIIHPDPVARPGFTWTPRPEQKDVMDRIDLILFGGRNVRPVSALTVGDSPEHADRVAMPWPSDHRAVVATFEIGPG